jgi:hypothetical protein
MIVVHVPFLFVHYVFLLFFIYKYLLTLQTRYIMTSMGFVSSFLLSAYHGIRDHSSENYSGDGRFFYNDCRDL